MKNVLLENSIIIKRTQNGWVAYSTPSAEDEDEYFHRLSVYEDDPEAGTAEASKSLCNLIYEQFEGYFQTKHHGGLKLSHEKKGRDQ